MKEPIIDKKMLTVMFGFFFIGGVAAVLEIYRKVKNAERPLRYIEEEYDGDIFV